MLIVGEKIWGTVKYTQKYHLVKNPINIKSI